MLSPKMSNKEFLIPIYFTNYYRIARDPATDYPEGVEHWLALCHIRITRHIGCKGENEVIGCGVEGEAFVFLRRTRW